MGFFSKYYSHLKYPKAKGRQLGLRNGQIGAIHSIAAHFTLRSEEPAIVVMPTGSGKTAVLEMVPFVLQSKRVLVVTTRRLVRNQIAEDLKKLSTLRKLKVFTSKIKNPNVIELENRIVTKADWVKLKKFDVVVATPNSISPVIDDVPQPPTGLFDLLLIDEAHHVATKSWNELLEAFHYAEKVFFTATPFRRDKKEIKGRFVYEYPLKVAYEERIFGQIEYIPVVTKQEENNDEAIAKKANEVFIADKKAGFDHYLMVRTDKKKRADELSEIYSSVTNLKLRVVHSDHSYAEVKKVLKKLSKGELDGIICVDMMSEGFDFPKLKIAAIHTPHKSLEITLQFIGRFARTNAKNIGKAKFLAIPSEIEIERTRLYEDGAVWQDIIIDLSSNKIGEEKFVRESIEKFSTPIVTNIETEDISLYSLTPFSHVKIYQVGKKINLNQGKELDLGKRVSIVYWQESEKLSSVIFITKETEKQRWSKSSSFMRTEFDLFVVHYDKNSRLLFINASETKSISLYEDIAYHFTDGVHKILPISKINRVLREIDGVDVFNLGMRNRTLLSTMESYRILSGKKVQKTVDKNDGRNYRRGHLSATGLSKGKATTIGYSSSSKIWSMKNIQIPVLIRWCENLANLINDNSHFEAKDELKYLPVGKIIKSFKLPIIAMDWGQKIYSGDCRLLVKDSNGNVDTEWPMVDLDLKLLSRGKNKNGLYFQLVGAGVTLKFKFNLNGTKYIEPAVNLSNYKVIHGRKESTLEEFFNNDLPSFYDAHFSEIRGEEYFQVDTNFQPFDKDEIVCINWRDVDIEKEYYVEGENKAKGKSLHEFLKCFLNSPKNQIVLYDHGNGEIADLVTLSPSKPNTLKIVLYHVKKSGGPKPGARLDDIYEVCGQINKSISLLLDLNGFYQKLKHRVDDLGSYFIKGDLSLVKNLLFSESNKIEYELVLVQPGVSKSKLNSKLGENLAAARSHIKRSIGATMVLFGSK